MDSGSIPLPPLSSLGGMVDTIDLKSISSIRVSVQVR